MAVIKAISSKAGIGQALDYVTKEEKTEDKLVSGLHCEPDTVKDEMQATKELWGKTGGRTYKHFVHSYHEDEHITPASYDSCMLGLLLYGVLTTVFTAVRSEAFVSDFKTFFEVVWGFLLTCFGWLENGANFMAQIGDKIPQEIVATIVHWLLWFIVLFGVGIGAVVLLLIGIAKLVKWYAEEYADNTSLGFALVSLALSIFFAEEIRAFLPINLLLLLILVHIVYVLIRWYVKGCMRSRGYY